MLFSTLYGFIKERTEIGFLLNVEQILWKFARWDEMSVCQSLRRLWLRHDFYFNRLVLKKSLAEVFLKVCDGDCYVK